MCVCDPPTFGTHPYCQWIAVAFFACMYGPQQVISFIFGLVNIALWMVAQFPQVYMNYKSKSAGALSFTFIFTWLLGDVSNLLGCLFTFQLPTQVYTAIYFVAIDVVLLSQYFYYEFFFYKGKPSLQPIIDRYHAMSKQGAASLNSGETSPLIETLSESEDRTQSLYGSTRTTLCIAAFLLVATGGLFVFPHVHTPSAANTRVLLQVQMDKPDQLCNPVIVQTLFERIAGDISAWASGLLYFFGRIPQVVRNYQRKETGGLSVTMFACAFLANVFYGFSIVLMPIDYASWRFWESIFPYILGSWFTMTWPVLILVQFVWYGGWGRKHLQPYFNRLWKLVNRPPAEKPSAEDVPKELLIGTPPSGGGLDGGVVNTSTQDLYTRHTAADNGKLEESY